MTQLLYLGEPLRAAKVVSWAWVERLIAACDCYELLELGVEALPILAVRSICSNRFFLLLLHNGMFRISEQWSYRWWRLRSSLQVV